MIYNTIVFDMSTLHGEILTLKLKSVSMIIMFFFHMHRSLKWFKPPFFGVMTLRSVSAISLLQMLSASLSSSLTQTVGAEHLTLYSSLTN